MNTRKQPKKQPKKDWHRADIVAALRKAGWSLRKLGKHHNYKAPCTLGNALQRPWPKGERLIADAIGINPWEIWPTRYNDDGHPNRKRRGKHASNSSTQHPCKAA